MYSIYTYYCVLYMSRDKAMKAMKQSAQSFASHMDTADSAAAADADDDIEGGGGNNDGSDTQRAAANELSLHDPAPPCIICQLSTLEHGPVCYLGFDQASNLLYHPSVPAILNISDSEEEEKEDEFEFKSFFECPKYDHVSFCGHSMHKQCFDKFLEGEYLRLSELDRRLLIDRSQGQFLCPLCKKLSNCIIPHVSSIPAVDKQVVSDSGVTSVRDRNITEDMMNFLQNDLFTSRSLPSCSSEFPIFLEKDFICE